MEMDCNVVKSSASNMTLQVKQEKEDPEIDQLVQEFVTRNKQKMAEVKMQNNRPQAAGLKPGQQSIKTYFGSGNTTSDEGIQEQKVEETPAVDYKSQLGQFGWITLGKEHIPFIFRKEVDQYCAVRMVEIKLINKYVQFLPPEVFSITCIKSYFMTENECKLFNEINQKHCDFQFGQELFTTKDVNVRTSDADQLCKFLEYCYKKLVLKVVDVDASDRCGFFRINGDAVMPFTVKEVNGTPIQYVPLFYFEGEIEKLEKKVQTVDNWELSYLKLCGKVQGIKDELFVGETCKVVSLEDIKSNFSPNTAFKVWWPRQMAFGGLVNPPAQSTATTSNQNKTRKPSVPPAAYPTNMHTQLQSLASQNTRLPGSDRLPVNGARKQVNLYH